MTKSILDKMRDKVSKQSEQLKNELAEVKKNYPLVYMVYLLDQAKIMDLAFEYATKGGDQDSFEIQKRVWTGIKVANPDATPFDALKSNYQTCKRNRDRVLGATGTTFEDGRSAIETFMKCIVP